MPLQVGIIGAGVAGLSAAIALRRAGHHVEAFERSQFKNEVGAALSLTPNGGRIFERWGFDSVKAGATPMVQVRRPKGDTLAPMAPTLPFGNARERFGADWNLYHRVDVHRQLLELATNESDRASGPPASIRLGCQVLDVDCEAGLIFFKDGTTVQKDLIVIADGQHDLLNAKITSKEVPMQRSGQTAYRCLIPMKDILADEITRPLFENQEPGFWAPALPAKGVMVVTYPCRNNEVLNCIVVYRKLATHANEHEQTIEDWNFPATHDELRRVTEGFEPSVQALLLKSPEVKVYTQMKRAPIGRITKGKAILIGDAAHPMLLTHAQGVSSSIEDAASLEILLQGLSSESVTSPASSSLLKRLSLVQDLRLPRNSATQLMTDPIPPGPNAPALQTKLYTEIRKHYSGTLPPKESMPHSPQICDHFFSYDVTREAEKALTAYFLELEQNVSLAPSPSPQSAPSPITDTSVLTDTELKQPQQPSPSISTPAEANDSGVDASSAATKDGRHLQQKNPFLSFFERRNSSPSRTAQTSPPHRTADTRKLRRKSSSPAQGPGQPRTAGGGSGIVSGWRSWLRGNQSGQAGSEVNTAA